MYVFPTVKDAEFVFLNTQSTIFPVHLFPIEGMDPEQAYREYIRWLLQEEEFLVEDFAEGWILLKRVEDGQIVQSIPSEIQLYLETSN